MILISNARTSASEKINLMAFIRTLMISTTTLEKMIWFSADCTIEISQYGLYEITFCITCWRGAELYRNAVAEPIGFMRSSANDASIDDCAKDGGPETV